jgi:AhpD family alkylhydroperoxidase
MAAVYRQMEADFGLVAEPFVLHHPLPRLLAAVWATFRETVIVQDLLDREAKETIAVALSRANRCPYCADSHSITLHALGRGATERALAGSRRGRGADPALLVFAAWAAVTRTAAAADLAELPYTPEQAPEAIGTALCFHYVNRMVTPLLGATPLPSPSRWLRRPQLKAAARRLHGTARSHHLEGASLTLLAAAGSPAGEPPEHLAWAAPSPRIHAAFAALDAAVAAAGEPLLGDEAAARVDRRLAGWRGEEMPPGDGWPAEVTGGLPPPAGAAARLALLAALGPHRIGDAEVAAFRAHHPSDGALIGALAWGSYAAARRVSTWLRSEVPPLAETLG